MSDNKLIIMQKKLEMKTKIQEILKKQRDLRIQLKDARLDLLKYNRSIMSNRQKQAIKKARLHNPKINNKNNHGL